METASDIIDFIGHDRVKEAFGVSDERMRQVRRDNKMPANWYDTCERLAGRPLARTLFAFKGTPS